MNDEYGKLLDRFWSKVDTHNEDENICWEWLGGKCRGYGLFKIHGKSYRAHRFVYELMEKIPEGMCVLHKCDNPSCVNPYHLKLGTRSENSKDRDNKGRQAKEERNGNSILTRDEVGCIKEMIMEGYTQTFIAKNFSVSLSLVNKIANHKLWKEV